MAPVSAAGVAEIAEMTGRKFTIRLATMADHEQLSDLWEIVDALHRHALPDLFHRSEAPPRDRTDVEALIAGPSSAIFVAAIAGDVIGAMTVLEKTAVAGPIKVARRYVEIDEMAVKPTARRKGVARALIQAAADWAEQRGVSSLELNVYEFNEAAQPLYRATGFSTVRRRMSRKI